MVQEVVSALVVPLEVQLAVLGWNQTPDSLS